MQISDLTLIDLSTIDCLPLESLELIMPASSIAIRGSCILPLLLQLYLWFYILMISHLGFMRWRNPRIVIRISGMRIEFWAIELINWYRIALEVFILIVKIVDFVLHRGSITSCSEIELCLLYLLWRFPRASTTQLGVWGFLSSLSIE